MESWALSPNNLAPELTLIVHQMLSHHQSIIQTSIELLSCVLGNHDGRIKAAKPIAKALGVDVWLNQEIVSQTMSKMLLRGATDSIDDLK
ncbi:hypothetical protein Nepgr_032541 [Nepenthes gracilis]|uniref:Uncharacterized protein n=1 Tax=Nepenthes gracilis TaxID=150966 RepID=A0AAD3TKM8_NEPGR|nr:hypothetical protein Nepgr_032541 [Nepenthes gracilis]